MATNMEKVTQAVSKWGLMPVEALSQITGVSYGQIYKLAKQGNSSIEINNGTVFPKQAEIVEKTAKNKVEVECKKHHVPEHLILMNGESLLEVEQKFTIDLYRETLDALKEMGDDPNPALLRGSIALINQFLIKINKELEEENK